ncbi:hypothetical protein ACLEPN_35735, partial [Myxococcus sp. 1LA]
MRRADARGWGVFVCVLMLGIPGAARAQSQEEKRRQLQERLGIKQPPAAPKPAADPAPEPGAAAPGAAPAPAVDGSKVPVASPRPGAPQPRVWTFAADARPILEKQCASCHRPEGMAGRSKWVLRGEAGDYEATLRFVKVDAAAQSPLLRKGTGATFHGGKKSMSAASAEYATLVKWIEGGALQGRAPQAAAPAAPEVASATPAASSGT